MAECPRCGEHVPEAGGVCPRCGAVMGKQLQMTQGRTLPEAASAEKRSHGRSLPDGSLHHQSTFSDREESLEPGTVLGNRYEIVSVVGKGGMGWVYKAKDRQIDRIIALKIIRQDLAGDESIIRRFSEEIVLAREVTHKNVLRMHDIGEADGFKFISMPYVDGRDLKTIISERGALDVEEAIAIAIQILEAIKAAHEAGVVHRDLKPQNVLIDADGIAYVADFGIAKSVEEVGFTATGQIIGTPDYMSPEQAQGKEVDFRTDLYAFGVVLYEMLTGQVPFKADSVISAVMMRLSEKPPHPSVANPKVPKWLDGLVLRALESDVSRRYQSANEILEDIRNQSVHRKPKLAKRTMLILAGAVLASAALVMLLTLRPVLVIQHKKTYVGVLPFKNLTGETGLDWLTVGIQDNLTAGLTQSRFFRVMSAGRLHQIAQEMGKELVDITSSESVRNLAKISGLDAVIGGHFVRVGDQVRVTVTVENLKSHESMGAKVVQANKDDILNLIDQVAQEAKIILGLSTEDMRKDYESRVGSQRTRSITAASHFARGMELSYLGDYLGAAIAFQAAIDADGDFAMAYAKASEAYSKLGYDSKAESLSLISVDKLVKFVERIPLVDRHFILGNHAEISRNTEQAIANYKQFLKEYPDNPEGYYSLALAYDRISDWKSCEANLRQALKLDPGFLTARMELAEVLIEMGKLDDAVVELTKAYESYREIGNREGEATALNALGIVHRHRNQFTEAISVFKESIRIREELGDKRGVAVSLGNLGLVYKLIGRHDDALKAYETCLQIRRQIGDNLGISTTLNKIAQIYENMGQYKEALANYERSYEIRKQVGSKNLMASSLSDMAGLYSLLGNYQKSVELDSSALVLSSEVGDDRGISRSLRNIAEVLISRGLFDQASTNLHQALAIDSRLGDARLQAADSVSIALHYLARGKIDSAIMYLDTALRVATDLDTKLDCAAIQVMLGEAYRAKGNFSQAMNHLDNASAIAEEIGVEEILLGATMAKAMIYDDLGYKQGYDSLLTVLIESSGPQTSFESDCRIELLNLRRLVKQGDHNTGRLIDEFLDRIGDELVRCRVEAMILHADFISKSSPHDARLELERTRAMARSLSLYDLESEVLGRLAALELYLGNYQSALTYSKEAVEEAQLLGARSYEYLAIGARACVALGDSGNAVSMYVKALDELLRIYQEHCLPGLGITFIRKVGVRKMLDDLAGITNEPSTHKLISEYSRKFRLN